MDLPVNPGAAHDLVGQCTSGHLDRVAGRGLAAVVSRLDPVRLPGLGDQEAGDPPGFLALALRAASR